MTRDMLGSTPGRVGDVTIRPVLEMKQWADVSDAVLQALPGLALDFEPAPALVHVELAIVRGRELVLARA